MVVWFGLFSSVFGQSIWVIFYFGRIQTCSGGPWLRHGFSLNLSNHYYSYAFLGPPHKSRCCNNHTNTHTHTSDTDFGCRCPIKGREKILSFIDFKNTIKEAREYFSAPIHACASGKGINVSLKLIVNSKLKPRESVWGEARVIGSQDPRCLCNYNFLSISTT